MNKLKDLIKLCQHHVDGHTSTVPAYMVEFVDKLWKLSHYEHKDLADWISKMPKNGDGE